MKQKTTLKLASALMGSAALLHLVRVIAGWELVLNGWVIPVWVSILAILIAGYLAWSVCRCAK